jgi:hypothetical protein
MRDMGILRALSANGFILLGTSAIEVNIAGDKMD